MMMPANYSVIAENELSYVEGGASFIDWIGDRTAPLWTAANVKTFNTNIVTLVGNAYVGDFVQKTVGVLFSKGDTKWADIKAIPGNLFGKNVGIGSQIFHGLGLLAGAYNLGNVTVANKAADVTLFPADAKGWKESKQTKDSTGKVTTEYIWG